jgi:hypothetical protein
MILEDVAKCSPETITCSSFAANLHHIFNKQTKNIQSKCTVFNTKVIVKHLLGMSNRQHESNPLPDRPHQERLPSGC